MAFVLIPYMQQSFVERFLAEIVLLVALMIFVLNYFYGSSVNKSIAVKL